MIQRSSPQPAPSRSPERPLVIMVGSGPLARTIAESIGGDWVVRLLDPAAAIGPRAVEVSNGEEPDVTIIPADGTSRLVLRRVGAEHAGATPRSVARQRAICDHDPTNGIEDSAATGS